ncbi:hypothetical protein N7528_006849 [Penicillium herquei]|nr:hypothetical protein N7528_006849 [Penicillium herquei]
MPASEFFRPISCMLHALTCIVAESAEIFALDYAKAAELGDRIFDNQGFENLSDSQPRPYLYMVSSNSPNRVATDPRDRIYAFRSVANDHDLSDFELRPDYEASVEEVYSRFARWCLFKKNDMSYLAHAGMPYQHEGPPSHTEDIPSWVADWTRKERPDFGDYFLLTLKPFKAGSALEPTISWEPNRPRLLFIKGRVVDTVTELAVNMEDLTQYYKVLMSFYQGKAFKTWLRWVFYGLYPPTRHMTPGLQEAHQAVAKYGPMKGPLYHLEEVIWMENCKAIATRALGSVSPTRSDVFWRTMMRDRTLWGAEKASPDLGNRFGEYLDFLNLVRSGELRPSIQSAVPLGEYLEMEEPMTKAQVPPVNSPSLTVGVLPLIQFPYKRFCSTAEGRLGWVPNCAKPGDLICVFDGVTVPFVIRPRIEVTVPKESSLVYWRRQLSGYFSSSVETKPESQPEYVLVGECYVHGLMDGEAMDRQDVESELITLS